MTKRIGHFLCSIIGEVIEIAEGESGNCDGIFIRVRVAIEVDKLLQCCLRVDVLSDKVEYVMLSRYERLLDHCFQCGMLGHKIRECTSEAAEWESEANHELLFGLWLRATSPTK
ncbi:hypothetical protein Dsin_003227 [Dipteronia sinensis]|uniref:CCHC-type domain-containing protein n=1 Tax=Dipteronia sinensis TaxID=43782 RepID=A0AAE0B7P6_9ROSI|nr:hypothetical protein Dsin_003227 [Dipteronia sinensis]